ncbi:MAG: OsmC family protein [Gammaproteobacteria bacterium]|nr:OsmC family protein [Gammaproteobacteria bacterium]
MSQENIRDLTGLKDSVQNLLNKTSKNSNFGKFNYTVDTHWEGGVLCKARVRNEHNLVIDEKPILGGCDLGVSPVELVLVALGTCQEIMYSVTASRMNIELEECDVKLKAELDVRGMLGVKGEEASCPGFTSIDYVTTLKSDASRDELANLIKTVEKQCPVLDMLTRKVEINSSTIVNKQMLTHEDKVA